MTTDHRGRPTGTNHRPTPRLNQVLNAMWGGNGQALVNAHRAGSSKVYDMTSAHEGLSEAERKAAYHQTKAGFNSANGPYHDGLLDHNEAVADMYRDQIEVQSAVDAAGGTAPVIGVAIRSRKSLKSMEI